MKVHYINDGTNFSGLSACGQVYIWNDIRPHLYATILKKNVTCKNCLKVINAKKHNLTTY